MNQLRPHVAAVRMADWHGDCKDACDMAPDDIAARLTRIEQEWQSDQA